MQNMLLTLPAGILVIILLLQILRRVVKLVWVQSAGVVAMLIMTVCGIWGSLDWPGLDVFAMHLAIYYLTLYISVFLDRQRSPNTSTQRKWHWAPVILVGFFTCVVLLNTVFVVLANSGTDSVIGRWLMPKLHKGESVHSVFPGVVSHDYREKEEQFNAYQEEREAQRLRGWQVHYGWKDLPIAGQSAKLELTVRDKHSNPIEADRIYGHFYYPADSRVDQAFSLQRQAAGLYATDIILPHAGHWDLVLYVEQGNDHHEVRAATDVLKAEK